MTDLERELLDRLVAAEQEIGALRAQLHELATEEEEAAERAARRREQTRDRVRKLRGHDVTLVASESVTEDGVTPSNADSDDVTLCTRYTALHSVTPAPSSSFPTPHITPSSPRSLSITQSAGGVPSGTTSPPSDPLEALVERITLALPEARRVLWLAFLRDLAPVRRAAWAANLGEMLDGDRPNLHPTPPQVGLALGELIANGDGDNSRLFTGYVRRAMRGELRDREEATKRDERGRLRSEVAAHADKASQAELDAYDGARRKAATAWMDAHPAETAEIEAVVAGEMTTPPDAFGYRLELRMRLVAEVERRIAFPEFDAWQSEARRAVA